MRYRTGKLLAVVALAPSLAIVLAATVKGSDGPASQVLTGWGDLVVSAALVATVAAFLPTHRRHAGDRG